MSTIALRPQVAEAPLRWAEIEERAGRAFLDNGYHVRPGQQPGTAPHPTLPTLEDAVGEAPVLLYRDTNSWCPFCERVRPAVPS